MALDHVARNLYRAHMVKSSIAPGNRYGTLTVLESVWVMRTRGRVKGWSVLCDCGKRTTALPHNLVAMKSCGHLQRASVPPAVSDRLRMYKHRARRGGHLWELSDEYAVALLLGTCADCGEKGTELRPLGITRRVRDAGYDVGNSQACCYACRMARPRHPLASGLRARLQSSKGGAKSRALPWELSDGRSLEIFLGACTYCGTLGTKEKPLGIDRKDSSLGYTDANSQSCCGWCNYMKSDYTHDEFVGQIRRMQKWLK